MFCVNQIKFGDVYWADLSGNRGSEQGGCRPVFIFQNNIGNKYSSTVLAAAITSVNKKPLLPTHVLIKATPTNNFERDSVIMFEQIRTIDKERLGDKITSFANNCEMKRKILDAMKVSQNIYELERELAYAYA